MHNLMHNTVAMDLCWTILMSPSDLYNFVQNISGGNIFHAKTMNLLVQVSTFWRNNGFGNKAVHHKMPHLVVTFCDV